MGEGLNYSKKLISIGRNQYYNVETAAYPRYTAITPSNPPVHKVPQMLYLIDF